MSDRIDLRTEAGQMAWAQLRSLWNTATTQRAPLPSHTQEEGIKNCLSTPQFILLDELRQKAPDVSWDVEKCPFKPERNYKLDILIWENRFAIEVNGGVHRGHKDKWRRDHEKMRYCQLRGWCLVPVTNDEILAAPQTIAMQILGILRQWTSQRM